MRCASLLLSLLASAISLDCAGSHPETPSDDRGQPFEVALHLICDVDRLASVSEDDDEITVESKRHDFLDAHLKNPDAIYYRTLLRVSTPDDQLKSLSSRAKEYGLKECPLAETLAAQIQDEHAARSSPD